MDTLLLYHPCAVAAVITNLILGPVAFMLTDVSVSSGEMEVKQFYSRIAWKPNTLVNFTLALSMNKHHLSYEFNLLD